MNKYKRFLKYIYHQISGRNSKGFGIHSPYIFHLVTEIIHDYTPFYCYSNIESQRRKLRQNTYKINVSDYGSGSIKNHDSQRTISNIAKYSLKPKKQAQLLFRLINYFGSKNILEMGTSLGITSCYLASVSSQSKIVSLEGCPEISKIASNTFKNLNISNIELITGEFRTTLPLALKQFETIDFVFFDGHHEKNATIKYFNHCLPYIHNNSVFVFDDIHLNSDMELAWKEIKNNDRVKVTLDLFHLGIVFFKHEFTKQHFNIKF